MSAYETFREDIPEFIRGRLNAERAAALLKAAEDDEVLRAAIESERSLERWLDYYEVAEPAGLEGRFWRRFHEEKVVAGRRSLWLLKLAGPLAAAVLIAVGVILFINDEETPPPDPNPITVGNTDDSLEVTWDDVEFDILSGVPTEPDARGDKLDAEALATMRALDNPAFLALDDLAQPEDLAVIEDFDVLKQIAEEE
jgi:hypothetical protein